MLYPPPFSFRQLEWSCREGYKPYAYARLLTILAARRLRRYVCARWHEGSIFYTNPHTCEITKRQFPNQYAHARELVRNTRA